MVLLKYSIISFIALFTLPVQSLNTTNYIKIPLDGLITYLNDHDPVENIPDQIFDFNHSVFR